MEEFFVAVISIFLVFSLISLYLWKRHHNSQNFVVPHEPDQVLQRENVVRAGGARRMRRRPAFSGSTSSTPTESIKEFIGENDDGEDYESKQSKKREKKRQEREAKRQVDQSANVITKLFEDVLKVDQSANESRFTKQDKYAEMRRRRDEEREAKERMLEEEAKARKSKEEEAAALEFEAWKGEFSIDSEGTTEKEAQDGDQGLLSNFVEYIKKHKYVAFEDLAAEFGLRTQDCINRIASLENMGRLSGVMDDRGKYIYISEEEMKAVADYVKRKGRVSISHLAAHSNRFIDLDPKPHIA